MPSTRGGPQKRKFFTWSIDSTKSNLVIINENGRCLIYSLGELKAILTALSEKFGTGFFPLGNNVALLGKGTENSGFGMTILEQIPGDITLAQGASYLGVVLEQAGYLVWNRESHGIAWRLVDQKFDLGILRDRLLRAQKAEGKDLA